MAANPERRIAVLDAALAVLADGGGRALTHRAVDKRANLPPGTTVNYYRRREDLVLSMVERAFERLAPSPQRLAELASVGGPEAEKAYLAYVVERLLEQREVSLALLELRLEAARNAAVREKIAPALRSGYEADVAFHQDRGLLGGRARVLALHHLVNGLVLDALTVPLDPTSPAAAAFAVLTADGGGEP